MYSSTHQREKAKKKYTTIWHTYEIPFDLVFGFWQNIVRSIRNEIWLNSIRLKCADCIHLIKTIAPNTAKTWQNDTKGMLATVSIVMREDVLYKANKWMKNIVIKYTHHKKWLRLPVNLLICTRNENEELEKKEKKSLSKIIVIQITWYYDWYSIAKDNTKVISIPFFCSLCVHCTYLFKRFFCMTKKWGFPLISSISRLSCSTK